MRFLLSFFLLCGLCVFCMPEVSETRLKILVKEAEIVALVEVTDVQPSPGFWSGQFPAIQNVSYKVLEVFKGSLKDDTFNHNFFVIKNHTLSDKQKPQLSPSLFARQKKQLVFLKSKLTAKEPTDNSTIALPSTTNSPFQVSHVLLADGNTLKELKRVL